MGGSAGSFHAFESFFKHMPTDSGMAFVIILHLDPSHKGQIAEVFQPYTAMPVQEVKDGTIVRPDHVYLIPPNKDIGIHNKKLLLLSIAKPGGIRQPIDYFLQSLAEDQWNKAVAVIFSGMGSDGETGVRMIKEKLGMAMVQDPETAEYRSMPEAAIGTNLVDYVLAPEEMPVKLIQYLRHPVLNDEPSEKLRGEIRDDRNLQKILMLIRSKTGHDFSLYKKSTISRRIDRRVAFHQQPDYAHYINHLRENPGEVDVLFNELLIGVTKFFRDPEAFAALKDKMILLLQMKPVEAPVRVWVAGCSTGEEAYSIAMLLIEISEILRTRKISKIQIFATDLDAEAIEHARAGVYHSNIVADVSSERIDRFFIKKDNLYSVKKELREMIVFAQHNVIKDAPFTRLDLLCCRNVMIYLTTDLQKKIIPVFHYALHEKGILFLGTAETIGGFNDMFTALDPKWKIFTRKVGSSSVGKMIDFQFNISRQNFTLSSETSPKPSGRKGLSDEFNKIILEEYTPASVLINDRGDILYINGKTGKYLELPSGEAAMNIIHMAREELRYVLGNAIHEARLQKKLIHVNDIKLKEDGKVRKIDIKVNVLESNSLHKYLIVVFEDKGIIEAGRKTVKKDAASITVVEELEKELMYTKQQLHGTIEQMETSVEELKSTNEELQSTNEELQSTNEESLTTKEEMQSLNEELMTINQQYQNKADELTLLNNDMKNLLDSTEIGTIFLDNNLDILRFTPQVKKLFNVIISDIGRPITHVVSNFDYPSIEEDIKEVVDKLTVKELEVKTKEGEWYAVRIMPYRTLDNFINGAVLTFNKITHYKQMEFRLKTLENYAALLFNLLEEPAILLDKKLNLMECNKAFFKAFHLKENETRRLSLQELIQKYWKTESLDKLLKQGIDIPMKCDFKTEDSKDGHVKTFTITTKPFINEMTKEAHLIVGIITEKQDM